MTECRLCRRSPGQQRHRRGQQVLEACVRIVAAARDRDRAIAAMRTPRSAATSMFMPGSPAWHCCVGRSRLAGGWSGDCAWPGLGPCRFPVPREVDFGRGPLVPAVRGCPTRGVEELLAPGDRRFVDETYLKAAAIASGVHHPHHLAKGRELVTRQRQRGEGPLRGVHRPAACHEATAAPGAGHRRFPQLRQGHHPLVMRANVEHNQVCTSTYSSCPSKPCPYLMSQPPSVSKSMPCLQRRPDRLHHRPLRLHGRTERARPAATDPRS